MPLQAKLHRIAESSSVSHSFQQFSFGSLVQGMLKPAPAAERRVNAVENNVAECFERLEKAALPGAIVADERGQPAEFHTATIADGLKVFDLKGTERRGFHCINPRSTSW
jgi:hypothetical protein